MRALTPLYIYNPHDLCFSKIFSPYFPYHLLLAELPSITIGEITISTVLNRCNPYVSSQLRVLIKDFL